MGSVRVEGEVAGQEEGGKAEDAQTTEDGLGELSESERACLKRGEYMHGQLWRAGAEAILDQEPIEAFLVRETGNALVLSLKTPDMDAIIQHHTFALDYRGYITVDGELFFQNIPDLIHQHIYGHRPIAVRQTMCISHPVGRKYWELLPSQIEHGPSVHSLCPSGLEVYQGQFSAVPDVSGTPSFPIPALILAYRRSMNRGVKRAFLSEAMTLTRISTNHPSIVRFYGTSLLGKDMKLVKELSIVGSLRQYLSSTYEGIGLVEALTMGASLASALEYLDQEGVVHLDITSTSCFLYSAGPHGHELKLTRFLRARRAAVVNIREASAYAARWSAPEVLAGGTAGSLADVFSLGVVLWELLSAPALPWTAEVGVEGGEEDGALAAALLARLQDGQRLRPPPTLPLRLANLLADLHAFHPKHRPRPASAYNILSETANFFIHKA